MLAHSVRIKLDGGNDQVLHPGQIITGTVEYKAPPGERVMSLNVDFRGVTKIIPKKGSTLNTEYIEIFHMGESMLRDPNFFWTNPGEKYIWDFSFVIPTLTGPDRSDSMYKDSGNPLFEERIHGLPPSMEDGLAPEVRVEYTMYAVAKEQFQPQSGSMQQEIIQTRPVVHNLEQLRLIPDLEQVEYGEVQTYGKTFESAEAPKRRFSLTSMKSSGGFHPFKLIAKVPSTVIVGENIEVDLSVDHPQTTPASDVAYTHKLMSLTIQARTHRRTTKVPHDSSLTSIALTKMDARKASRPIPIAPAEPLQQKFSTDALLKLPPSFKSYSISREYHLLLDVTLVGDGKREFNTQWVIPVKLLYRAGLEQIVSRRQSTAPPPPPPLLETEELDVHAMGSPTSPRRMHQRRGVDDDLPPAYQPRYI